MSAPTSQMNPLTFVWRKPDGEVRCAFKYCRHKYVDAGASSLKAQFLGHMRERHPDRLLPKDRA